MIHDIPVSLRHTIILDLPLTFSPFGIVRGKPMLHFDRTLPSRFGVIPRLFDGDQDAIRWFIKPEPCMIFHCANTWDEIGEDGETIAVRMLACQFRTSALAYGAGGLEPPSSEIMPDGEADIVRLTFHRFEMATTTISHEIVLSEVPFEFPVVAGHVAMQDARYVYGLSLRTGSFDAGRGAKPDCLVKMDVRTLIERGMADGPDVVDGRSIGEIIAAGDAADRAADFADRTRDRAADLADDVRDRLGGAADEARNWVSGVHRDHMRRIDDAVVRGSDRLDRGRTAVEQFVTENPLLVGVVGVAAGLLLGALLPRTRQEDRNIGPYADEVRDQGLRYAREFTSRGREFVETALDPDNIQTAAQKAGLKTEPAYEGEDRTAHRL